MAHPRVEDRGQRAAFIRSASRVCERACLWVSLGARAGGRLMLAQQKGVLMPDEDYKALTLRLYATIGEIFRTGDVGLLDPLLSPDMVDHTPASGPIIGPEPGKQLIASFARAFPDTTLTVDLMVGEDD